jgi:hypothetical protein
MMRRFQTRDFHAIAGMGLLAVVSACATSARPSPHNSFRVEPKGQLVVASHTGEAQFEEVVSRNLLARFVNANARIRVETRLTFDFYYDFKQDGCRITFDPRTGQGHFSGGFLRVKKPVIQKVKIFIVERSLWINEEREAVGILEHLTTRLSGLGEAWKAEPAVQEAARRGMGDFMKNLALERGWPLTSWSGPGHSHPIPLRP